MFPAFVFVCIALVALPCAFGLARLKPSWSRRRIVLLCSTPIPGTMLIICFMVYGLTFLSEPTQCLIDHCLDDRETGLRGTIFAVVEWLASASVASYGVTRARRGISQLHQIFR